MAPRLYIVPAATTTTPFGTRREPKYFSSLGVPWGGMDYGFQPVFLIGADLSVAQDTSVVANADVFAFPFNLQATISGAGVNARKNRLEDFFIPGDGVFNGMTEQACARYVAGLIQFMQRLNGVLGNEVVIDASAKLNVQWSAISANYQAAIIEAAQSLGYDTSFIGSNTQLRAILKNFSDQWGTRPFIVGPITL